MSSPRQLLVIGAGANLGDRLETLYRAERALEARFGRFRRAPIYESAPILRAAPTSSQPDYLNTVLIGELPLLDPRRVLAILKELERSAGRLGGSFEAPRSLDLDLLLFGDLVMDEPPRNDLAPDLWPGALALPHPRLRLRRFVLQPLADLEPDLELPPDQTLVSELLSQVLGQRLWPKT